MPETSNPTPQRGDSTRNSYGQKLATAEETQKLQKEIDEHNLLIERCKAPKQAPSVDWEQEQLRINLLRFSDVK
jgi:hypothetical protein